MEGKIKLIADKMTFRANQTNDDQLKEWARQLYEIAQKMEEEKQKSLDDNNT